MLCSACSRLAPRCLCVRVFVFERRCMCVRSRGWMCSSPPFAAAPHAHILLPHAGLARVCEVCAMYFAVCVTVLKTVLMDGCIASGPNGLRVVGRPHGSPRDDPGPRVPPGAPGRCVRLRPRPVTAPPPSGNAGSTRLRSRTLGPAGEPHPLFLRTCAPEAVEAVEAL